MGQLAAVVDPAGNRATQEYDREGRSVATTDYHGRTFRRGVDQLGRTSDMTGPDGARVERTYHPIGELASVTDPAGRRWTFDIDGLGRLVSETDPNGGRTIYTYTPGSRLAGMITPAGREYRYGYDDAGRPASMVDPDGIEYVIGGDQTDDAAAAIFAEQIARFQIDHSGRVTGWSGDGSEEAPSAEDPNTSRLDLGPLAMLEARGDDHPSQFEYDQRGLLQSVTDPAGAMTEFLRDMRGRVVGSVTGEQTRSVQYDPAGAVSQLSAADGRVISMHNTPAGRLESFIVEGADIGQAFTYDEAGRVASASGLTDGAAVHYEYDPTGLLRSASNENGTALIGRDLHGSIASVTGEAGPDTAYDRDLDGLVVRRVEADGQVTDYDRTAGGRLIGFTDSEAGVVGLPELLPVNRDRAGRVTVDEYGRTYAYDEAGRIAEAVTNSGRQHFTYNDLGLLATDRNDQRQRTFRYDIGGRLVQIDEVEQGDQSNTRQTQFAYDAAGRRIGQTCSDESAVDYRWNDLNQLVAIVRTGADGTTSTRRVRFSGLGRPELVDDLAIGWDDAMMSKPVRIGQQRFLRSGMHVRLAEPDTEWFDGTFDDPWGFDDSRLDGVGLGYRGELTVDGLVFMGDRVYDPATRTFLSHDPLPPVPGENGAFGSPYSYSWCDPVNYVDPSGREPITVEEFDAWKEKQETNRFERAVQAMIDDPWGTLAMVGVIAVGTVLVATGVGAGIGAGILIGAATAATMGLATDNFSPTSVAISGAFGGVTGGGVAGAAAAGFGESVVTQLVDGRGFDDMDWGEAGIGAATGGVLTGAGDGVGAIASGAARRFGGPAADVAPSATRSADVPPPSGVGSDTITLSGHGAPAPIPANPDPVPLDFANLPGEAIPGREIRIGPDVLPNARTRTEVSPATRNTRTGEPVRTFDIVTHGRSSEGLFPVTNLDANGRPTASVPLPIEATRQLLRRHGWVEGQPIRLVACHTASGDNPVAQQYANHMGTRVTGATDEVQMPSGGQPAYVGHKAGPRTIVRGEWRDFEPVAQAQPAAAPDPPPMLEPAQPAPAQPTAIQPPAQPAPPQPMQPAEPNPHKRPREQPDLDAADERPAKRRAGTEAWHAETDGWAPMDESA